MDQQNNGFEISEDRLEEIRKQAREQAISTNHSWKQRGGWIVCESCPNRHAIRISPDTKMVGIENNMPVLKRRGE